jgi:hypothetical protein
MLTDVDRPFTDEDGCSFGMHDPLLWSDNSFALTEVRFWLAEMNLGLAEATAEDNASVVKADEFHAARKKLVTKLSLRRARVVRPARRAPSRRRVGTRRREHRSTRATRAGPERPSNGGDDPPLVRAVEARRVVTQSADAL